MWLVWRGWLNLAAADCGLYIYTEGLGVCVWIQVQVPCKQDLPWRVAEVVPAQIRFVKMRVGSRWQLPMGALGLYFDVDGVYNVGT